MSVIGEVASIAGIVSLAGQTLQAASSVYNLLKAFKRVDPRVVEIEAEIARLKETLQDVTRLSARSPNSATGHLSNLHTSVLKCGPILESLKLQLQPLEATSNSFFRKLLKKAKIAADVEYFPTLSHQIQLCRADISLCLQLLQSATSLVICEQMDTVTVGFDKARESQAATSEMLLVNQGDIIADIADARSEQSLALSSLNRKVDQLMTMLPTGTTMTSGVLAQMDARLKLLEGLLAKSVQTMKTNSDTMTMHFPETEPRTEQMLMRLVKPGILNYEENGRIVSELLPIDDRQAMKMDVNARKHLVRHVQGLRIMLWLLRQDNYRSSVPSNLSVIPQSCLTRQAKVTSRWEFCYSCTELKGALRNKQLNMSLAVPWTACKYWLQYLFDRIEECGQDGEYIMELTLLQWPRFPVPDRAMPAAYFLPIPRRLLEPARLALRCIQLSRSSQLSSRVNIVQRGDKLDSIDSSSQNIRDNFVAIENAMSKLDGSHTWLRICETCSSAKYTTPARRCGIWPQYLGISGASGVLNMSGGHSKCYHFQGPVAEQAELESAIMLPSTTHGGLDPDAVMQGTAGRRTTLFRRTEIQDACTENPSSDFKGRNADRTRVRHILIPPWLMHTQSSGQMDDFDAPPS